MKVWKLLILLELILVSGLWMGYKKVTAKNKNVLVRSDSGDLGAIRGIELNPMVNGALENNPKRISIYMKAIRDTGANTVGLYNCGAFDWEKITDVETGKSFCQQVYGEAEKLGLGVIPGYFSNPHQDWSLEETSQRASRQFKELVNETKQYQFVKYYLIGNELFEKLSSEKEKDKLALWISSMTEWLNENAPEKEIIYADNSNLIALPYLINSGAKIKTYAINDYEWGKSGELAKKIEVIRLKWPGIKIMLHEWGVDSLDASSQKEEVNAQAKRIVYLAKQISMVEKKYPDIFVGALYFSFTDDWGKVEDVKKQNPDQGRDWICLTCFDKKANEEYWGIEGKRAYWDLKNYWTNQVE
ncbi:MAG: hypothetical protein WC686_05720 [Candidatus Shapirobacteria bacterium]|jgi:hypothetical protein